MSLYFSGPASCTRSGWRKPAAAYHPIARGERNHSTKTDRHCKCGLRSHGGLTVAALVNERSCIAQVAVSPANVRTAEPPRAGDVSPPWYASTLVQQETFGAAGAIPGPRRADTRRSCRTCVCAPRMSLFFNGPTSCTRSAWRKPAVVVKRFARAKGNRMFATIRMRPSRAAPGAIRASHPWCTIRSCVVNVITPRKPIAIAGAATDPRRADARRS
jgi:hypothetical protein